MSFESQRNLDLQYQYRKLERGIRIMMKNKHLYPYPTQKIQELRSILKELGGKPSIPRWPL